MNFIPRMESRIQGFSVQGGLKWRVWDGVVADLWDVSCSKHAEGRYISPDPRLFIVLELDGDGAFDLREEASGKFRQHQRPFSMSYIPAGLPVNSRVEGLHRIKHLDLHFDEAALTRRFGRGFERDALHETRLQFHDDTVAAFGGLIAAECGSSNPTHDLYGESLVNALFAKLFSVKRPSEPRRRMALPSRRLRLLTDYIDAHCLETIRLSDLANLAGLSESATSHAFKAATGMPPHRWQMYARTRKVQDMMLRDAGSLADIAEAAGFFDQAHMTRVFKSFVGLTPAAWKKGRAGLG